MTEARHEEEEHHIAALHIQADQMIETMKIAEEGFQRLLTVTIEDHKLALQEAQAQYRQIQKEHDSLLVNFNWHHQQFPDLQIHL